MHSRLIPVRLLSGSKFMLHRQMLQHCSQPVAISVIFPNRQTLFDVARPSTGTQTHVTRFRYTVPFVRHDLGLENRHDAMRQRPKLQTRMKHSRARQQQRDCRRHGCNLSMRGVNQDAALMVRPRQAVISSCETKDRRLLRGSPPPESILNALELLAPCLALYRILCPFRSATAMGQRS